jgi:hypothetical protein
MEKLHLHYKDQLVKVVQGLVPYDAVNRNKVSICQLPLFYFPSYSLHVSAPMGHPQVRYTIDVSKDYSFYNGSAVRTQLDVCLYRYFDPWSPRK